jgi:hypothetical protein
MRCGVFAAASNFDVHRFNQRFTSVETDEMLVRVTSCVPCEGGNATNNQALVLSSSGVDDLGNATSCYCYTEAQSS